MDSIFLDDEDQGQAGHKVVKEEPSNVSKESVSLDTILDKKSN
jgi:hypothetical protein